MPSHIVLTQPIHTDQVQRLVDLGHRVTELGGERGLLASDIVAAAPTAQILICQLTDHIDAEVLALPNLTMVATVAAGYDNIDVGAAAEHRVMLTHTPGVLTSASADLTIALMLAVARHIPVSDSAVRSGGTGPWRLLHHPMGTDISGQTLGIVGMGRIGRAVAQRAHHGFGMSILYHSRRPLESTPQQVPGIRVPLEELLSRSHVVSLHAPLNNDTRHLINTRTLQLMRSDSILINTARGGLVDEVALAEALTHNKIGGAGLDVFEHEPDVHPSLLACGGKVVLTPHIGSATAMTRHAMATMAIDDVLAHAAGEQPKHVVSLSGSTTRAITDQ